MNRGSIAAIAFLIACLFAGAPKAAYAQTDSLKPRIMLSFDSLTLDVYNTFRPPIIKAVSYKGDTLLADTLGKVDTAHVGTYTIGYYAVDSLTQRSDTAYLRVYVVDRKRPRLSLLGNLYLTLRQGRTYREPGISVTDNYDPDPTILTRGTFQDTKQTGLFYIVYQALDSSGNISDTAVRYIEVVDSAAVGIEEAPGKSFHASVFPLPARDFLTIRTNLRRPAVGTLVSVLGQIIMQMPISAETTMPLHGLPAGLYYLDLQSGAFRKIIPIKVE